MPNDSRQSDLPGMGDFDKSVAGAPGRRAGGSHSPNYTQGGEAASVQGDGSVERLTAQRELLDFIATGPSLERMSDRVARVLERVLAPAKCAIHVVQSTENALNLAAAPTLSSRLRSVLERVDLEQQNFPYTAAVFRRKRVILADIAAEPMWRNFAELAMPHGHRACWSYPVLSPTGEALVVLTLLFGHPHRPSDLDQAFLDSIASLTAMASLHDRGERSRRHATERLASLASTIPGVVYQRRVSPDGDIRYTYISEGAQDLFGVSPEEVMADPNTLFKCHGPEYRDTFRERLLQASRDLTMWDVEAQIITPDGEEKWTHAIARPHREPDGSVLWDGVILDATRIKKAELELREAKEAAERANLAQAELGAKLSRADDRFSSLAASIPGAVYQRRVSPDGNIRYTYISEGAQDLFGVSPEEIVADPNALFDCHGPEFRGTFRERLLQASRDLTMWDVEAQIITREGEEKWTHAIARPHREPDGSVLWDGVILDATRIKQAEFSAAASAARTRKIIVESIPQGFMLFDPDDHLVICNARYLELYPSLRPVAFPGTNYEEIVRAELESFADRHTRMHFEDRVQERLKEHELRHHAFERRWPDGRWILVSEHRSFDGSTVVLFTDITEQKRREESLEDVNRQLDIAMENMAQGICVYDADMNIVLVNRRYSDIFGFPLGQIRKGMGVREHLDGCFTKTDYSDAAKQDVLEERLRHIEGCESATFFLNLPDGRTIEATHRPLADGGAVETFSEW